MNNILVGLGLILLVVCVINPNFWLWVAYERHGYYRILEERFWDKFIYRWVGTPISALTAGCGTYLLTKGLFEVLA